ncbi:MAG: hypothetical protein ACKOED_15090 [Aestuariivirga sp.]|uniref:hypothetical protein n=1 Tax=Aestuariivirga sp. TaxID=2650926 RepID=UPI0038D1FABE
MTALRTIPGLASAVPQGEALNAAPDAARLRAYDQSLASAIAALGTGPDIALRLLDVESLVHRVSECATSLGTPLDQVDRAAAALDNAFRANVAHYALKAPRATDSPEQRRLQERMLASTRLTKALAASGRTADRDQALRTEAQLIAAAEAEWEAGREAREQQRMAEERARNARAEEERVRQASAQAIMDDRLITRAVLTEFKQISDGHLGLNMSRGLSEFTTRPGDQPGFSEYWNYDSGEFTFTIKGAHPTFQRYRFSIRDSDCRKPNASKPEYLCTFTAQTEAEVTLAGTQVVNDQHGPVRLTTPIVWNGSRWSAPLVRAAAERSFAAAAVAPSSGSSADPNRALCRSLHAGVAAAGGQSTSGALSPQTWGC